jgi:hypothetical protein
MHSALYVLPIAEMPESGSAYYCVGHSAADCLVHAEPGAEPIGTPLPGFDGIEPWTWVQLAAAFPSWAALVVPHEWAGESTAADLDASLFPLLSSPPPPAE